MIDYAQALEASALADALRRSRWIYPLVNAGHILGLGLLVGAVLPMDWAILRGRTPPALHNFAVVGLLLAAACGLLLFVAQATEYVANGWFQLKIGLLGSALLNALVHLSLNAHHGAMRHATAVASFLLWPSVLICGRMVAYS